MEAVGQRAESFSIAVFPFLKTTAPVQIGDMTFRSTKDTSGLSNDGSLREIRGETGRSLVFC